MNYSPSQVLLDSSLFKALIDDKDGFHTQAHSIWENLLSENIAFFTTNYILDETFTLVRVKCGLEKARKLRNLLAEYAQLIFIIRISAIDETNAWDWFWKDWSKLSFTDCVSFAVMNRLDIEKVASFDEHFHRAGFQVVK